MGFFLFNLISFLLDSSVVLARLFISSTSVSSVSTVLQGGWKLRALFGSYKRPLVFSLVRKEAGPLRISCADAVLLLLKGFPFIKFFFEIPTMAEFMLPLLVQVARKSF